MSEPIYYTESILIKNTPIYMIIRGNDINNPVLLYLHGGPGRSEGSAYFRDIAKGLEKIFTICYMEQRGAGKSYLSNISLETMTTEQFINDVVVISNYLRNKFNKEKIFVFGHSWGSLLGSLVVNKFPELYYTLIITGFPANQFESEKLSLEFIKQEATKQKKSEDLEEILRLKLPNIYDSGEDWFNYIRGQRKFLTKYNGMICADDKNNLSDKVIEAFKDSIEYTDEEKGNFTLRIGSRFSITAMWHAVLSLGSEEKLKKQKIPIFMIHGLHDKVSFHQLAQKYYETLDAPLKEFYTFENSAHSPYIEEYEKFESTIKKIIILLEDYILKSNSKLHLSSDPITALQNPMSYKPQRSCN